MKVIYKDLKKGEARLKIENNEDLWFLSHIIETGDLVRGRTFRKIKAGAEQKSIEKKPVFIEIKTEKTELQGDILKVLGVITQGPDDVPKGKHHSFNLEKDSITTVKKEKWLSYQVKKLKQATKKQAPLVLCILDRENAIFATIADSGHKILTEIEGDVEKKEDKTKKKPEFYPKIIKIITDYNEKYKPDHIIVASPAFWKEDLMKVLKDDDLRKKITLATCSSATENAIQEVLKRDELKKVLEEKRTAEEAKIIEELLKEISKKNLAAYGIKEVDTATQAGAVKKLVLTDNFIKEIREKNQYEKLDNLMKMVDNSKGEISIINSDLEPGKKLDGLGGIGAILRYKLNY